MKKPEEERLKERLNLFDKMMKDQASSHDLVRLSYLRDMISKREYNDYLKIEREYPADEDI